ETRLVIVVYRKEQVLRTRFRIRGQPAIAEEPDLLERVRGRQVDDVERHAARHLRQTEGAARRFALGLGWTRERVPLRCGVLLRERALHEDVDHAAVLRMHADEAADLGASR